MKTRLLLILLLLAPFCFAQTTAWDTSGNSLLKGTYYFRQIYYVLSGQGDGSLADAATSYGSIVFDGAGKVSSSSAQSVLFVDASSGGGYVAFNGVYSIAASGYGFVTNPVTGDTIYGMVNQQGIFIGAETDNVNGYNDLFIAVPVGSSPATAATFKGTYSLAYINLSNPSPLATFN